MSRPHTPQKLHYTPGINPIYSGTRRPRLTGLSGGTTLLRGGAFLAVFAIILTVFYADTSSAASPSSKDTTESSMSGARRTKAGYNFGAGILPPAMMFQTSLVESVETYAAPGCSIPKVDFNLGEKVCVRATFPSAYLSFRRITWIDPDNNIRDSAFIKPSTQTVLFDVPGDATSVIGDSTVDNRGTWRIDLRSFGGSRRATASVDVHEAANPRADLQISAGTGDDTVESGSTVPVKIVVYNAGPDAATNLSVSALSVPGLSLQSFNRVGDTTDCGSACSVASLAPRSAALFIATYSVTAAAGTSVQTSVNVTSETTDPRPLSNSDEFSFSVAAASGGTQTCTLTPPPAITVNGTSFTDPNDPTETLYGAVVNYVVGSEGDGCSPVQCDTPSGSFFPTGTTNVTCTAGSGEFTIFPVTVVDTRSFQINLNGANPLTVECHSIPPFADPGATTNRPGITPTAVSTVNPDAPGSYTITYTATDNNGTPDNTSDDIVATPVVRTVNVIDDSPPQIALVGDDPTTDELETQEITVECHTAFTDPGAAASDACDGPAVLQVSGTVDPNTVGTYTITYTATDIQGTPNDATDDLVATVTRTIHVVDTTKPVIALNGANPLTVEFRSAFTDPGATATDTCAGDLNSAIQVSGTVDPNTVGTYTLTYTVSDPNGNAAIPVTRTVNVLPYLFTGFFSPISNLPTVNMVKAGSAIPIKFSLSGNKGLDIFATDFPASGPVACNSNDPAVDLSEIDTTGNSVLSYNAVSDQYQYNWKTLKAWENTCRQLVVKLNDGTEHRAMFKFK